MCDITKWESHEWQMLLNEVFNTYWFQISENIDSSQLAKSKNTIIEILRALEFYYKTDEVSVDVFNLIMETLDYEEYKLEITRKIYDSMISANWKYFNNLNTYTDNLHKIYFYLKKEKNKITH